MGEQPKGYCFEDLKVGQSATFSKTFSQADINTFAEVSGDKNPVHVNVEFAKTTPFGGTIAHGILSASLISAALGTKLPGPGCIYMSQTLKLMAPVKPGDTVTAVVTVKELVAEKKRAIIETKCMVGDKVVIEGEAMLKVPSRG
jgi:3-hydroxybutyryl-CoA dehydratase